MIVTAGKTNVSVYFYIVQDASATSPGEPVTGLVFSDIETGGSASYMRQGAARTDFTLVTLASASAAHSDGGFIEVDATNMPGTYRCDVPDAAFATGVDQTIVQLVVASANNAVVAPLMVDLTDVDFRDSVRGGMTALPNAAADAAGGLPISDAGGLDLDSIKTDTAAILVDTGTTLPGIIGTPAGVDLVADIAAVKADTAAILIDTAEIGAAGAGLTAVGIATGGIVAASFGAGAIDAAALAADAGTELADALLNRDMSAVSDTNARSPLNALRHIRNKWSISGTTLTVTKEDDSTSAWTSTLTAAAGADPISGSDPA